MNLSRTRIIILCIMLYVFVTSIYAAIPIDLSKQKLPGKLFTSENENGLLQLKENRRDLDFKNTLHIRVQQTYAGHPVWGGDGVVHIKQGNKFKNNSLQTILLSNSNTSMNGTMYHNLQADLAKAPEMVFSKSQSEKALQEAIKNYQNKTRIKSPTRNHQSKLIVYIDDKNKAHWSYLVSFITQSTLPHEPPANPSYIMDATSFFIYEFWNDMKTHYQTVEMENVAGGGFGGNMKMGQLIYDGMESHLSILNLQRDAINKICYFKNSNINIKKCIRYSDYSGCVEAADFWLNCPNNDTTHNNTYWNGDMDAINGGYSPSNDALFNGDIVLKMYRDWIGLPVLTNTDGSPMNLTMVVHIPKMENAFWDGERMNFGDGDTKFYPLTSLGVTAHEISHGFTQQHSDLYYDRMSGGINEAFSDMAAKAAEFYVNNKDINWELGSEITKDDSALRYMDQPSKDCKGGTPGYECSIDNAEQYNNSLDVHYSSGVYNRFFYLLSTSPNWNTKKAFQLMAHANAFYWTSTDNFNKAACNVLKAAADLDDNMDEVKSAFTAVKINTDNC